MTVVDFERSGRKAFTMIEMLVTIVIVLLLTAILLRSVATFSQEARRKQAVVVLEALQNALNEYYAEYGRYPPVNTMAYVFEHRAHGFMSPSFRIWLDGHSDVDGGSFFLDAYEEDRDWPVSGFGNANLGYEYGLVSHLYHRDFGYVVSNYFYNMSNDIPVLGIEFETDELEQYAMVPAQSHWYNRDTARDIEAKRRWENFLMPVPLAVGQKGPITAPPGLGLATAWTNFKATIKDPWGREYRYESKPPYARYRLWSTGPRGAGYPDDNIADETWSE